MDETLKRRLLGASVLLLLAFGLASLLPGPDRKDGDLAQPVVAYDLRTGKPLNLQPYEPPRPPVRLKPVEIGSPESLAPKPEAPKTQAKAVPESVPTPKPESTRAAKPAPATAPAVAAAPAQVPAHSGRPALKVDENFGSSGGWYVQIGSFASRDNARLEMQKLYKLGLPAMMQNIAVGKKLWYRVRVGPYASEPPAQQALASVRAQGNAKAKVVRPDAGTN